MNGDGTVDIIAGLLNANVVRYDPSFNLVWRVDSVEHGTGELELLDLDADGKLEVACANKYGAVEIFNAGGAQVASVYSELGDVTMAFGDLDGDGKIEVANGSSTGAFTCQTFRGKVRFRFPNYGFAVRAIAVADVRGDRCPELLMASETGYVYLLGPDGKTLAQRSFGDEVTDLRAIGTGSAARTAVACADGNLSLVDGNLETVAIYRGDQPLSIVEVMSTAGQSRLLAATADALICCTP